MITIQDKARIHGEFHLRVFRRGMLIEEYEDHNLIVNGARAAMARLVANDGSGKPINRIAFGTNGAAPSPANTVITAPFTKAVAGFSYPATGQVQINWNLLIGEANGKAIMEFGLICTDGTLFARKNRTNAIAKDSDISLEGQWIITF
ncbi:MAG: hypothetical protein LBD55_03550 [Treponema sp.]|jgi:hypothetical protein|nr:hypothetical protein [Treponema sp.]